jgi:transcriptional regulator
MSKKHSHRFGDHKKIVEKEMIDLRKQGWTLQKIGERYGVTRQAVCYILRKHRMGVRNVENVVRVCVDYCDDNND